MHIVTLASLTAGAGKSTLAAHLVVAGRRYGGLCLPIDADPDGSLTRWNTKRSRPPSPIADGTQGFDHALSLAGRFGCDWVLIDTPSAGSRETIDAVRAADLVVIPVRAVEMDIAAVKETVDVALAGNTPYFTFLNDAPTTDRARSAAASARVQLGRLGIPVWSGQISRHVAYAMCFATGRSVLDLDPQSAASGEIINLWSAVSRVVGMIAAAGDATKAALGRAA